MSSPHTHHPDHPEGSAPASHDEHADHSTHGQAMPNDHAHSAIDDEHAVHHAAETAQAAIAVVAKGIAARGVPQRLLTDNGIALNPHRRGFEGELVAYVSARGIEAITGKPYRPTTQGKNERLHQTLFRWLDTQPLAATLTELQAQVDAFDEIYNTQRPHQGLPGRITPQQAWDATPIAEPPRPNPTLPPRTTAPAAPQARIRHGAHGQQTRTVHAHGYVKLLGVRFRLGAEHAGATVHVTWNPETIAFFDHHGTHITPPPLAPGRHHLRAPPGAPTVTDVLTHQLSPMS